MTQCRSRDEIGGAKAQRRAASMTFMMLGRALELFTGYLLQSLRLQATSRYRPIAFDPEGSSLDRCLPVNNPG
jgi:hypothetical protein